MANVTSNLTGSGYFEESKPKKSKKKEKKMAQQGGQNRGVMGAVGQEMIAQMGLNNVDFQGFDLESVRKELEGPMPLRVICGIAGGALTVCAVLGMLNISGLVTHPARMLLQIYEGIFGLVICFIELKDIPMHGKVSDIAQKWMPFLTIVGGKGAFYIFVGSLGATFGTINMLIFIPAMVVAALGVVLVLYHFGKCKTLGEKYDMTIVHNAMTEGEVMAY